MSNFYLENSARRQRGQRDEQARPTITIKVGNADYVVAVVVTLLVIIGVIMVFSASYYNATTRLGQDATYFLKKQASIAALGFVGMYFLAKFPYKLLKLLAAPLYAAGCALMLLVQFIGVEVNGAKRWFKVPIIGQFQPSEVMKIGLILLAALVASRRPLKTWGEHIKFGFLVLVPVALIGVGNMSTAIVAALIGFGIMFIASPYILRFVVAGVLGASGAALILVSGWRNERVLAWLHPEDYATGKGWQVLQSLYAIGTGGFFGLGLGQSRQKMGFVPEAHNDIIFSIICEELGFMGAALLLLLFIILIWRGLKIAMNAVDLFASLVASGIVIMIGSQVVFNIAVVTNTMPNTGVPLPFISYGGTSLAVTMLSVGILLNISRFSRE
ncbi:MAG: FtsW/RodA/SpoVE family cell cycle protein [Clostridiales bacterium]|jgi:cell division protein FtsW|nr:FtsW/RodA/SpoVE family cell cycle protein [Clostridiales bacterium]